MFLCMSQRQNMSPLTDFCFADKTRDFSLMIHLLSEVDQELIYREYFGPNITCWQQFVHFTKQVCHWKFLDRQEPIDNCQQNAKKMLQHLHNNFAHQQ